MKKYKVEVPFIIWHCSEICAESKEQAIEDATKEVYISSYCGNGGNDKLVGVYAENESVYVSEEPFESDNVSITAEEIK